MQVVHMLCQNSLVLSQLKIITKVCDMNKVVSTIVH